MINGISHFSDQLQNEQIKICSFRWVEGLSGTLAKVSNKMNIRHNSKFKKLRVGFVPDMFDFNPEFALH